MHRQSYAWLLAALLLLAGCAKEKAGVSEWDGPVIKLGVTCVDPNTKAGSDGVAAGENTYHENLISWVDFYFFPGGDTAEPSQYHVRKESGKRDSDVFSLELSTNQVNYIIFPVQSAITETLVYAIANCPQEKLAQAGQNPTLAQLQALEVSTDFAATTYANHRQDDFLMSGTATLTLDSRTRKVVAQGLVELQRYACKITVGIKMDERVELSTGKTDPVTGDPIMEVWTARPREMQIYLVDGVRNVALGGAPAGQEGGAAVPEYFSYRNNAMRFFDSITGTQLFDKSGDYYNTFPSYCYPQHWDSQQEEILEPYLKLVLPWDRQETRDSQGNTVVNPTQKEFYYKILIPEDRRGGDFLNSFVRNNWYHYDVEVGMLGADTDEAAVPLESTLYIVYWQDKDVVVKHANIGNARYLSVEKTEYILHNVDEADIRYVTSHPVEFEITRATRPYYGEGATGTEDLGGVIREVTDPDDIYPLESRYLEYDEAHRKAMNDGKEWLYDRGDAIVLDHPLQNDYNQVVFDYSPYTITFRISHADSQDSFQEYAKYVTIVQNPAVYIEAERNSDPKVNDYDETTSDTNSKAYLNYDHLGFVFYDNGRLRRSEYDKLKKDLVNQGYSGSDADAMLEDQRWRIVHYTGGSRDIINIVVTVLPDDSKFVIGDPRTLKVDNLRNDGDDPDWRWNDANSVQGVVRSLQYYYPTDKSDRTKDMLAPSFRFSTKFSGVEYGTITYENAVNKCATYQEDGYPAGRWRLPTRGEIDFVAMLSVNKAFTFLFNVGGTYWSAQTAVKINPTSISSVGDSGALARCVYDSWYWDGLNDRLPAGQDANGVYYRDHFIWGDMPR